MNSHRDGFIFSKDEVNESASVIITSISFCISTYLNLDAIDGKQARRTGTSSPLGELFDHGCDAVNLLVFLTNLIQALLTIFS